MTQSWPVVWFDDIDSTNEEARRRAASPGFANQWIAARSQSVGRGRMGRVWQSPEGNLFSTALLRWSYSVDVALRLPFAAALAVADTVETLAPGQAVSLKWPNDVRINGQKLCGILVESGEANGQSWLAVGIGLNVLTAPEVAEQSTTSVADLRGDTLVTADLALEALMEAFAKRFDQAIESFGPIREAWLRKAEGLGAPVRITVGDDIAEGIFRDMAADGGLIVELPNGSLRTIRAGEVELIKKDA